VPDLPSAAVIIILIKLLYVFFSIVLSTIIIIIIIIIIIVLISVLVLFLQVSKYVKRTIASAHFVGYFGEIRNFNRNPTPLVFILKRSSAKFVTKMKLLGAHTVGVGSLPSVASNNCKGFNISCIYSKSN